MKKYKLYWESQVKVFSAFESFYFFLFLSSYFARHFFIDAARETELDMYLWLR